MICTAGTRRRDRGQVALEYLGFIPLLLIVALLAIQLGVAAYTANQAGTGARAAARMASFDNPDMTPQQAAEGSVSDWLTDSQGEFDVIGSGGGNEVTYTVRVKIPSVVPGIDDWGWAERSSTMPVD
ncbi:TadE/TadG family type IV pilus assembly protein [Streptomyces sp. NPDC007861]|uniref:TadE/TadG family type IV pilus assembly protein n=1 Tax=Streptomyces sp. NPDC007861 TaxID=3154893 RepID=UPI0033E18D62